jgi:hypothetical protein
VTRRHDSEEQQLGASMAWSKLTKFYIGENKQSEDQLKIWGKSLDLYSVKCVAQFRGENTNVRGPIKNRGDMKSIS